MSVTLALLSILFLSACFAQNNANYGAIEDGTLGGFSNGLRYVFRLSNYYGVNGRPGGQNYYCPDYAYQNGNLPAYNRPVENNYRDFRVCFFKRDSANIYTTSCEEPAKIVEEFLWQTENFTLPYAVGYNNANNGGAAGVGAVGYHTNASDFRWVSFDAATRYDYYPDTGVAGSGRYRGFNTGYVNNQYTVLTLTTDKTRVAKYSVFTEYCVYEYLPQYIGGAVGNDNNNGLLYAQKTFTAFPYRTNMYSTQVLVTQTNRYRCNTGFGDVVNNNLGTLQANADRSVCVNNCLPGNWNLFGWVSLPRYVCIRSDEYNHYTVTDCLDNVLAKYRHTWGGVYDNNINLFNNPHRPYSWVQSGGGLKVVAWSNYTGLGNDYYSAYRLEGNNGLANCGGTWSAPLTPINSTATPPFYPAEGVYRFYSNIPTVGLNNWHFINLGGLNNGVNGNGGLDWNNVYPQRPWGVNSNNTWWNMCYNTLYNPGAGLRPRATNMPMTVCLQQTGSNKWTFQDCDGENTYATFGWNGVEWTGTELGNAITVAFSARDNNGVLGRQVTGYTFIHAAGMCTGTFEVRQFEERLPARVINGRYSRSDPAQGFKFSANYYRYADYNFGNGGSSYNSGALQRCVEYAPPPAAEVCIYNLGDTLASFDCETAAPIARYSWNGVKWEQPAPWGITDRNHIYIKTASITPEGFTTTLARGGCFWNYTYTYNPSIAHTGPAEFQRGHYTRASSATYEGVCYADPIYNDVQIHPEGVLGLLVREGSTGEIVLRLNWDRSLWVGRDELRGSFIYATTDADGLVSLHGQDAKCGWTIHYTVVEDVAPLPPIIDPRPENLNEDEQSDPPIDAFGVWNGYVVEESITGCDDSSLLEPVNKFETVCVHPHGPAKLVVTQCSDDRGDERFTTIMEAWWDGAQGIWVATDEKYWYTFALSFDEEDQDDNKFIITATSDTECGFTIELWRGDDCYTKGWKAGIITFSLLLLVAILIIVFLISGGGVGAAGGATTSDYSSF